jgi:hypothetical protein
MLGIALTATVVVLGAAATLFAVFAAPIPIRWHNDGLAARKRNFLNLLGLTTTRLVLVTGRLHHQLYVDPAVLRAFETLPPIDVTIYHERDLDRDATPFLDAVESRHNLRVERIDPDLVQHGAIFDYEHGKIEAVVPDDATDKAVEYFAYDRKAAREYEAKVIAAFEETKRRAARAA